MKIALVVVAALIALIVIVCAVGAMLPKRHSVTRSALIARPPADVYALIRELAEHGNGDGIHYEIVEDQPPHRFVTRIADKDLGYGGSWTYQLAPENGGTRVTITEDGEVTNVFFRFMSRFVFGHTATMDKYLAALQKRLARSAADQAR